MMFGRPSMEYKFNARMKSKSVLVFREADWLQHTEGHRPDGALEKR